METGRCELFNDPRDSVMKMMEGNEEKQTSLHFQHPVHHEVEEEEDTGNTYRIDESEDLNRLLTGSKFTTPTRSDQGGLRMRRSRRLKRISRRSVLKNGELNFALLNVTDKSKRFMQDLFNTLLECKWRYTLLVFFLGHFVSWFLFALLWYLMAAAHGDLYGQEPQREGPLPCVINMHDFTGCFMYSMESQTTIGYGTSYPSKECPEAVFLLCSQSIIGLIIQAFTVGIVFSKMTRPRRRAQTLLFSRSAVVALRDGFLSLQFRLGDIRKEQIVNTQLRAHLLRSRTTLEGELVETDRAELSLTIDGAGSVVYLIGPATAVHRIDRESPLYDVSPKDLLRGGHFEILVFLEGDIQATGQTIQARTSYSPGEILWGHRLCPMVRYNKELHRYEADYKRFHETVETYTPLCSARDLDSYRNLVQAMPHNPGNPLTPDNPMAPTSDDSPLTPASPPSGSFALPSPSSVMSEPPPQLQRSF